MSVTIAGTLTGGPPGRLRIVLSGAPADGGVSMRTSAVTLTVGGVTYRGRVTALDGDQLAASVASTAGAVLALAVAMNVDPTTAAVAGTVGATPRN